MDSSEQQYYKEHLIAYFRSLPRYRNADEQVILGLVTSIEVDLLGLLKSHINSGLNVVYEFLDKDALNKLINNSNEWQSFATLKGKTTGELRESIRFYKSYLDSKKHPLAEKEKKRRKKNPSRETKPIGLLTGEKEGSSAQKAKPEVSEPESFDRLEGKKYGASVTRYERDRSNRKACIAHYGYVCQVCGMNFEQAYGELGKEFIEVHHLHPVAQGERKVNPIDDLVPLCSNCHSMIHRQDDVSDWQGLRDQYFANKQITKDDE